MTTRVLFLCNHNASRSQMAEALLRRAAGRRFEVESAGVAPTQVHPLAVAVMREIGIDISGQRAKDMSEIHEHPDIVITLCEEAKEACPVFPGAPRFLHWSLPDPSAAQGDEAARTAVFRRVRDDLALLSRKFIEGAEE
jgi:arsenate reductase (thioredoxin)